MYSLKKKASAFGFDGLLLLWNPYDNDNVSLKYDPGPQNQSQNKLHGYICRVHFAQNTFYLYDKIIRLLSKDHVA